jgi:Clostripain family
MKKTAKKAKWTVMVYMNGDNNLEPEALTDFREMAKVGSTPDVNVVVQLDRNGGHAVTTPQWKGACRFLVKKGMQPQPASALKVMGDTNMGSPNTLGDFIRWSMERYPAQRYMLDIWNHGQGWRLALARPVTGDPQDVAAYRAFRDAGIEEETARRSRRLAPATRGAAPEIARMVSIPRDSSIPNTIRYVSTDDTSHDFLYNREVQDVLETFDPLDLVGFDACLMAMIETGYALRKSAKVMVGSEELEPGAGWNYADWLAQLAAKPSMDAIALGKVLVDSYRNFYDGGDETVTLSALRMDKMNALADAVDALADELIKCVDAGKAAIVKQARSKCSEFAPGYGLHGIDLCHFCDSIAGVANVPPALKTAAGKTEKAVQAAVIASHAGKDREGSFGAQGLSIYFPSSKALFKSDDDGEGYLKSNLKFPVQFVQERKWADFLAAYYRVV